MHRRRFLALCGPALSVALSRAFAKGEFWNEKPPAEWSEAEIERLTTKSPWAKEVTASFDIAGMQDRRPAGGGGGGKMGGKGGGGGMRGGGGMGPGGGGGGGGKGGMREIKTVVRWESAGPMREALKKKAADDKHYVISVAGLRMPGQQGGDAAERRQAMAARLRESTTLAVKGKEPCAPESVEAAGQKILLRFSRESLPIQASDKEAVFTVRMGPIEVKAKFALKEMTWKGQLAL
jgi:hypothetical protein